MRKTEFGLGAFAVGIMLSTHENRLKNLDDLWIDCGSRARMSGHGAIRAPVHRAMHKREDVPKIKKYPGGSEQWFCPRNMPGSSRCSSRASWCSSSI